MYPWVRKLVAPASGLPALAMATMTMYGGSALLLAIGFVMWEPGRNPRWVIALLTAVAVAFFVYTLHRGERLKPSEALVMASAIYITLPCLTWTTTLDLAAYSNGTALPIAGIYVIWFLHPVWGRVLLYAGLAAWFMAILHHGQPLAGFAIALMAQTVVAAEVFARIKVRMDYLAHTDSLTHTLNRRGITDLAERELVRAARTRSPLSIVAVDLDGLREVNNELGHGAGDDLLESVAQHWASRMRRGDAVGRIGGDEFLLILRDTTLTVAEDIVKRLAEESPGNWSAGVAMMKPGDTLGSLIERADQRLYDRKAARHDAPAKVPPSPSRPTVGT